MNCTESFFAWFGQPAQSNTTKTPSSFMPETVERLRTALKQLILEDRRPQLTSRSLGSSPIGTVLEQTESENGDLSAAACRSSELVTTAPRDGT
jgi:hypothetical protein